MRLLRSGTEILGLAVLLAALSHLILWDGVVTGPATLLDQVTRLPAIEQWPASRALTAIERGTHQPVDLRRNAGLPFIGNQIAWQLPLPHSLTIFARYREAALAATKPLVFVVAVGERDEGLRVSRALCEELGRKQAVLVVGGL